MKYYLGGEASWLWDRGVRGPLSLSYFRTIPYFTKAREPALVSFGLTSGAFGELFHEGKWRVSVDQYVEDVWKIREETGKLDWAMVQDWPCNPDLLMRMGHTIEEHQRLTVQSWEMLRSRAPRIEWMPVLHGQDVGSYLRHYEMYEEKDGLFGISFPLEGVMEVLGALKERGARLHLFGIRLSEVGDVMPYLESAESSAWAWGLDSRDKNEKLDVAEEYRKKILGKIHNPQKPEKGIFDLFGGNHDQDP